MDLRALLEIINNSRKSVTLIVRQEAQINNILEGYNLVNLRREINNSGIKEVYYKYIYPIYTEKVKSVFIIEEDFSKFKKEILDIIDDGYGYSFYGEKILWHLQCKTYFIDTKLEYNFEEVFLTPIESEMKKALEFYKIEYFPQYQFKNYIFDFLVNYNGQKIDLECDGRDYHNPEDDKKRDKSLIDRYNISVYRFTGYEIYQNAKKCVRDLINRLEEKANDDLQIKNTITKGFDDKQVEAVNHTIGPCLVLAPAGSGKTAVLTQRIIQLIKKGVPPQKILAMTFTKKAQEEMKKRLKDSIGDVADEVEVRTFHSLCLKYLNANKTLMPIKLEWKVFSVMHQTNQNCNMDQKLQINSIIKKAINLEMLDNNEIQLLKLYKDGLEKNNYFTFDILIIDFVDKLKSNKEFRMEVQSQYDFVLVDECQDNNKSQQFISKVLASPQDNIFFVGDDDQCIFSFTGSSIDNILNLSNEYPNIKQINLEYNYRCEPKIVDAATNVIVSNNIRKLKIVKAPPNKKAKLDTVKYLSFDTVSNEAKYIAGYCKKYASDTSKVAVLYRKKYYVQNVVNELRSMKIPFYIRDNIDMLEVQIIRIAHSYLAYCVGEENEEYWRGLLKHGMPYISNKQIDFITSSRNKEYAIKVLIENLAEKEKFKGNRWKGFLPKLKSIKQNVGEMQSLSEKIEYIDTTLNLFASEPSEEDKDAFIVYKNIAKECLNFEELETKIIGTKGNEDEEKHYVLLFTIHSSKGKQFHNVFLIGLVEGILPSGTNGQIVDDTDGENEEERRVCYVGMTRAINKLYLSNVNDKGVPSRFIEESKEPKMYCYMCNVGIPKKDIYRCTICGRYFCPEHMEACDICGRNICKDCAESCDDCNNVVCKSHINVCSSCGYKYCASCYDIKNTKCVACRNITFVHRDMLPVKFSDLEIFKFREIIEVAVGKKSLILFGINKRDNILLKKK